MLVSVADVSVLLVSVTVGSLLLYLSVGKAISVTEGYVSLSRSISYGCASLHRSMKILIDEGATVDFFTDDNVDENSKALGYLTMEPLNLAIENNHVDCLR